MTLADRIVVLRDGVVEQVGSPMDLYNNPGNQFVAGFLGAPSMNFLPAGPLGARGATLGIRPEHLTVSKTGRIAGQITHVERLGGDTNLIVALPTGHTCTLRLFGQHEYRVDSPVTLDYADDHAFAFDENGARL